MFISVQFHGIQRAVTQTNGIRVPILRDGLVRDVFSYVRDAYPDLSLNEKEVLVSVNNKVKTMDHTLNPDDKITFLPHIGGG